MKMLSEEQIASLKKVIKNTDSRNRNTVLSKYFGNTKIFKNDKLLKVYELYKNKMRTAQYTGEQSMKIDIAKELGISIDEVNSSIEYIDLISKKVDYELQAKYRERYSVNQKNKLIQEQNKVRRKNESKTAYIKKEEVLRRQLDAIYKNYDESNQKGKLSVNKLRLVIKEIENKIKALGNLQEDRLVLAAMYADIGELQSCNAILSKVEYDKLSNAEKEKYKKAKVKEIRTTNINYITDLYQKGYSLEVIRKECEKQATSYRAGIVVNGEHKVNAIGLTPEFIKKVYDGLEKGKNKGTNKKNEKER